MISSGNAVGLALFLNPGRAKNGITDDEVKTWLRGCIEKAEGRDLIFSSELMQHFLKEKAVELFESLRDAGYEPVIIHYVRHALDQTIATYLQNMKFGFEAYKIRHGIPDLSKFLRAHKVQYVATLSQFQQLLPSDQIVVRLYDDNRHRLMASFLEMVTDKVLEMSEPPPEALNRSPTAAEQVVFRELAALPDGGMLCRLATDMILNEKPIRESYMSVSADDLAAFTTNNQNIVDFVNRNFIGSTGKLLIKSDKIAVGENLEPRESDVREAFVAVIAQLARRGARPKGGVV